MFIVKVSYFSWMIENDLNLLLVNRLVQCTYISNLSHLKIPLTIQVKVSFNALLFNKVFKKISAVQSKMKILTFSYFAL